MLHAFGHRVAMCCNSLGVVGSSLKKILAQAIAKRTNHAQPKGEEKHITSWLTR